MSNFKTLDLLQRKGDNFYRSQGTALLILDADNVRISLGWKLVSVLGTAFSPTEQSIASAYAGSHPWTLLVDPLFGGSQALRSVTTHYYIAQDASTTPIFDLRAKGIILWKVSYYIIQWRLHSWQDKIKDTDSISVMAMVKDYLQGGC